MNIFHKITLAGMKKNHTCMIVTIIGVVLSAAMITAVTTFAVSLQSYLVNSSMVKYGSWHVAFLDVDSAFVHKRAQDDGIASITAFENIGYAPLEGGQNPNKPYLFLAGFNEETFTHLPIKLLSGSLPESNDEVLIPAHIAGNGGVKYTIGDSLSLTVGNRMSENGSLGQHDPYVPEAAPGTSLEVLVPTAPKTYTVVGTYERPAFEEYTAPGYTLITKSDASLSTDSYTLFVTLTNPRQVRTYAGNTAESYSYIFNENVLRFMGLSDDNMFNKLLYSVGSILIILTMAGAVFLIYNAFSISLNERTHQLGILSSVGATKRQLRNSVLFEGISIGIAAIPIGIIIGIISIRLVIFLIADNFKNIISTDIPLTLIISAPTPFLAGAVSFITILVSAYIPAKKAAGRPIMENIRQTNEVKVELRAITTPEYIQRICGLEGMLALKNFKRNKKRYRSIILSLTLSIVLFISANVFGTQLQQLAKKAVMDFEYDICFYTQDIAEKDLFQLYSKLQAAKGIYDSSYQSILTYSGELDITDFSDYYQENTNRLWTDEKIYLPLDIQFIEDSLYQNFITDLGLPIDEYTSSQGKMLAVAKEKIRNQSGESELINMFSNPSMYLTIAPQTGGEETSGSERIIDITFVDTIPIDTIPRLPSQVRPYVFMIVAPYQLKSDFEIWDSPIEMGLTFLSDNPSQSITEMEAIIRESGINVEYTLYNVHSILEQNRNIVFVINVFTYIFIAIISLIAVANVFNTISTNIMLRKRELAMLRSVGMSDRSFNKMMNFECIFFGLQALLFGLPAASILSWLIYKGFVSGGGDIVFLFPWSSLIISIFSVFLVVFITMLYAVSRIKRENIIDILRNNMT